MKTAKSRGAARPAVASMHVACMRGVKKTALFAVLAVAAHAATATASGGVFDVTTFGATGDGTTKYTEAIVDGLPESHIQNVTFRNVDLNGGNVEWQTCQYVDNGVCEGSTNACPPCFEDRTK